MARYEFSDEKSSKFWEIEVEGDSYALRFGKIGTEGQSQTKTFAGKTEARKAANKATSAKVKKGYVLVGEAGPTSSPGPVFAEERNPELEAAIYENPEDLGAWAVFGDWLQSLEDPRGELVALEVARAAGDKKASIKTRMNKILKEQSPAWLGSALIEAQTAILDEYHKDKHPLSLNWKFGFIHSFRITTAYEFEGPSPNSLLKLILNSSSARFVNEINLGHTDDMEVFAHNDYAPCWKLLKSIGPLPSVRKFYAGDEAGNEWDISNNDIGDFDKVLPLLPNLEWLKLHGFHQLLKNLKHDHLKTLILASGGLPARTIKAVAQGDLPRLEHLEVWFGAEDYGASGGIKELKPLFSNSNLPALRHLGLQNSEFQNDIAREIVQAPLLKQLKTLDLSMGTMTDAGADFLLEATDALKHLEQINLEKNFLSKACVKKLKTAFGERLEVARQKDDYGEDELYVSVGE